MAAMTHEDRLDHHLDAERGVVGSLLIDESIVHEMMSVVDVRDFLSPANRLIFQAARQLYRDGKPVDALTVRDRVGSQYSEYMTQLMEVTPTSANWREYAAIMHSQATMQRIKALAQHILDDAVGLDDCRQPCADMMQMLADGRRIDAWTMREMMDDFCASQDPDAPAPEYVTYGLDVLDKRNYTEFGDVVMIGGYPSDGKTALALMIAYHMAGTYDVGFFSLETDKRKVRDRIVASVSQIDFDTIKRRALTESDWAGLSAKFADMSKRKLTVLQAAGMTVTDIKNAARAFGFKVVVIDYVQLITPEVSSRAPRSEQMADVSRALHTFAQESKTLVIELAQLTRQERGGWREPDMHDLKESGQFEQDADIIFLLYRPNPTDKTLDQEKNRILKIAKYKEGPRGRWPLYFDGPKQTFSVITDPDGKAVLRQLVNVGRKAKAKNQAEARGQQTISEFRELSADEFGNIPF